MFREPSLQHIAAEPHEESPKPIAIDCQDIWHGFQPEPSQRSAAMPLGPWRADKGKSPLLQIYPFSCGKTSFDTKGFWGCLFLEKPISASGLSSMKWFHQTTMMIENSSKKENKGVVEAHDRANDLTTSQQPVNISGCVERGNRPQMNKHVKFKFKKGS